MNSKKRLPLLLFFISLIAVSCNREDDNLNPSSDITLLSLDAKKPEAPKELEETMQVSPYFYEQLLFINHRGLVEYPENTFSAVKAAVNSGFKAVECDICMTKDNVFVLQHDATIDRCSNGTGRVNDMTYEDLLAYDFGSWKGSAFYGERIARLDDLLDFFKHEGLIIELDLADESRFKREWIPALYDLVKEKDMLGQTMFTATQAEFSKFLSTPRDIIISVSGVYEMNDAIRALALRDKVTLCNFSVPQNYLNASLVKYAHDNGVKIKTWTTTTQEETDRCVNLGADYIITEVPLKQESTTNIPQIGV